MFGLVSKKKVLEKMLEIKNGNRKENYMQNIRMKTTNRKN